MGAVVLNALAKRRIVLDTNVVVSALVFNRGVLAQLRTQWKLGAFVPAASKDTVQELIRILAYPKFRIGSDEQQKLLGDYLPHIEVADISAIKVKTRKSLPVCRDPKDQVFLELANVCNAHALVSGDKDLLCLDDPSFKTISFRILSPADFLERITASPSA